MLCKVDQVYAVCYAYMAKKTVQQQQQVFYSQASWGRLEIKPHEPKKVQNKSEKKGENKGL
jgi:hypothetical protein